MMLRCMKHDLFKQMMQHFLSEDFCMIWKQLIMAITFLNITNNDSIMTAEPPAVSSKFKKASHENGSYFASFNRFYSQLGWPSDRNGSINFGSDPKSDGFRIGFGKINSVPTDSKIPNGSPTEIRLHKYCIISLIYILIYALFN